MSLFNLAFARQRGGSFVLLAAAPPPSPLLAMWPDRVRLEAPGPTPARMILVRPDGYVAWAGDPTDPALPRALTTWFGAKEPQSV